MKRKMIYFVLLFLFVYGCSSSVSGPDVEQVKKDLVGQSFIDNDTSVTIRQPQNVVIQERRSDRDAKTEDVYVLVTVKDGTYGPARGVLVVGYKHFEQGWKIQAVHSQGRFVSAE